MVEALPLEFRTGRDRGRPQKVKRCVRQVAKHFGISESCLAPQLRLAGSRRRTDPAAAIAHP